MKPILYDEFETAFDTNGIGILTDTIDISVDQELNGIYELEMKYPMFSERFADLQHRAIILATVDPISRAQPFRIYRITKPSKGIVTVYARHVAYDLIGIVVSPFTAASVAAALNTMKGNTVTDCPFEFWTDKDTVATMTVSTPKAIWPLLGGSEGSFLDVYGGEYEFDRWTVNLHNRRGTDRGVNIRYGKNLTSLEQDANCANCFTGVYPYWLGQDGPLVELPEKTLLADGEYSYTKIYPLDLSAEWLEAPTEDQLRTRAQKYIKESEIGVPDVSIKVEFIPLAQTEEYKDLAILEQVLLGDTVSVYFPKLLIAATARAVKTRWKPLLERYDYVTIGRVKANIANTIVKQQQEISKKPDETVMNSVVTKLGHSITGAMGGSVRFLDSNGDGMPDELYIADNPDPNLAVKVWRFNYEGWASSRNGYNGPFIMGATLSDGLLADFVTTAHLIAGTIQSQDADTFFLDLDNGILRIKSVDQLTEDVTELKQNSEAITISVQKLLSEGVSTVTTTTGYTFNADGLRISKSGYEIVNLLDNTGMYVTRSGEPMLQANADGVIATDVTVRNYLIVGTHARFEDYSDGTDSARTGCFWI